MTLSEFKPAEADFSACDWEATIRGALRKECHLYDELFFAKAREAAVRGDSTEEAVYVLLGAVASLWPEFDSTSSAYNAGGIPTAGGRRVTLEDFEPEHVEVLGRLAQTIVDPEYRARVADVVWIRKRDFRAAVLAADAFVASADILFDPDNWVQCAERYKRALQVANEANQRTSLDRIVAHLELCLVRLNGEDPLFLSNQLMTLLLENGSGDPAVMRPLAEKAAVRAEQDRDWARADIYWKTHAAWASRANDQAEVRASRIRAAETHVHHAEYALTLEKGALIAVGAYERAIQSYREIPGTRRRRDELHAELLEAQRLIAGEMDMIRTPPIDLRNAIAASVKQVTGKSLQAALMEFALITDWASYKELREQAEKSIRNSIVPHLFDSTIVTPEGKTAARRRGILGLTPDEQEIALEAEMFQQCGWDWSIRAAAQIEPARRQLRLEHHISIQDFLRLVQNSPLVPPGREQIFARGFYYGFCGDFLECAHLLTPQFESSLRHLLALNGVITSKLDHRFIQDEHDVNALLRLTETEEALGLDLCFHFRGLLVSRNASNLRNRLAHGLMSFGEFFSDRVCYFWWLFFRLCCIHHLEHYTQLRERWRAEAAAERENHIRSRAYSIWEQRQATNTLGDSLSDWLAAEQDEQP